MVYVMKCSDHTNHPTNLPNTHLNNRISKWDNFWTPWDIGLKFYMVPYCVHQYKKAVSALEVSVMLLTLSKSTQLMTPCIRPYFWINTLENKCASLSSLNCCWAQNLALTQKQKLPYAFASCQPSHLAGQFTDLAFLFSALEPASMASKPS